VLRKTGEAFRVRGLSSGTVCAVCPVVLVRYYNVKNDLCNCVLVKFSHQLREIHQTYYILFFNIFSYFIIKNLFRNCCVVLLNNVTVKYTNNEICN
jgi:hypothetical protein